MTLFLNSIYSKKLKFLRHQLDATQEFVASNLSMSQQAYGKLERGKTNFTEKRIREICSVFKVTFNDFILLDDASLQKSVKLKSSDTISTVTVLNNHYEILFLESELRNIRLEQKIKNYKPYQEVSKDESPLIYVMI